MNDITNGSFPWTPVVTQDRVWAYAVNIGICILVFIVTMFMALHQAHTKKVSSLSSTAVL